MSTQKMDQTQTVDESTKGYIKPTQSNPKLHKSREALEKIAIKERTKKRKIAKREARQAHLASLPKRKVGRPTKYTREVLEITADYIDNYAEHGHKIPSIAGLATILKTDRETVNKWSHDESKPEFTNIIRALMSAQEHALTSNGLDGTYNATITKLILSKHGYHDKLEANQGVSINIQINREDAGVTIEGQTVLDDE